MTFVIKRSIAISCVWTETTKHSRLLLVRLLRFLDLDLLAVVYFDYK